MKLARYLSALAAAAVALLSPQRKIRGLLGRQTDAGLNLMSCAHRSNIERALGEMEQAAPAAFAGILVIPILAIFFLSDGEKLADQIIHLLATKENHGALESLASELHLMLQRYIRAKVSLGGLSLLFCSIVMLVVGLSERDSAGHSRRNTRIHSSSRLDDRSRNDRHRGGPYSLALDMDGWATRSYLPPDAGNSKPTEERLVPAANRASPKYETPPYPL